MFSSEEKEGDDYAIEGALEMYERLLKKMKEYTI